MPIVRLTQGGTFSPEEIQLMTTAFESACRIAGLTDPTDTRRDIIAEAIIECAQGGERDLGRLRDCGVSAAK